MGGIHTYTWLVVAGAVEPAFRVVDGRHVGGGQLYGGTDLEQSAKLAGCDARPAEVEADVEELSDEQAQRRKQGQAEEFAPAGAG